MQLYLNDAYLPIQAAAIPPDDRGWLLGDGLFETILVDHNHITCLTQHYQRLAQSAALLAIPFTCSLGKLETIIQQLVHRNGLAQYPACARITLTRGPGPRGLLPAAQIQPTLMITVTPPPTLPVQPYRVIISHIKRNEQSPLANIKSLCYLDQVLAKLAAVNQGVDDCILLNTQGRVACASAANIFILQGQHFITPQLTEGALPGITRQVILDLGQRYAIPISEGSILPAALMQAQGICLTNRLIGIHPVIQINQQRIHHGQVHPLISRLQKLYHLVIQAMQQNH